MSVLTDPATYGILNGELTNCPRTTAVLGELAAQRQQMMGTLQRVEQEAVSSQNMANAIESRSKARSDVDRKPNGERLYPKSWSGNATWRACWDTSIRDMRLRNRSSGSRRGRSERPRRGLTAATLKTTNMLNWTTVALGNVTEGAARTTVLKVTQTEPSRGFMAWQALVDGHAPKSSNDPAPALQPILATPDRCKGAKELKEKLTAWSLKVAEHEHQFKVIDEPQKIFVGREMMPKDIKREFLTGPRKFDEIQEKLEIIVTERPMTDLGNVGAFECLTRTCVPSLGRVQGGQRSRQKGTRRFGNMASWKGTDEWASGKRE